MGVPKIQLDLQNGILSVNGENFLDMSPDELNIIMRVHATFNYTPIPGVSAIGPGSKEYLLNMRMMTSLNYEDVNDVVDAHSNYSSASFGHNNREIIDEFTEFLAKNRQFLVHSQITTPHNAAFIKAMSLFSGMDRVFPKLAGTEATDTAIHAACLFWRKNNLGAVHSPIIVAADNCFHGRTETARRLSVNSARQNFGDKGDYSAIIKIPFGDISALKKVITDHQREIAAVLIEPIQGEGGVNVPPDDYLPAVVKLCDDWGVVSIFDEVQTGFGRAGYPFYFQKYGNDAKPDIVCFGKAAGAGLVPLSGIAGKSDVLACFKPGTQGSTLGRAASESYAGLIAMRYLLEHKLCQQSREKGEYLTERLLALQKKYPDDIKEIRGAGLFIGMELSQKHAPQVFIERLLRKGKVLSGIARGRTIRVIPPLVIDYKGLNAIADGIDLILRG